MRQFLCSISFLLCLNLGAQQFELGPGQVNTSLSDSRSVNFADFNQDGWIDLLITNGLNGGQADLLYLNDGNGLLQPISNIDFSTYKQASVGAVIGDVNNDSWPDAIISSWYGEPDNLYINDGHGFLEYDQPTGFTPGSFGEAATLGDVNGDGLLDVYITQSTSSSQNILYQNLGNNNWTRLLDHPLAAEKKAGRSASFGDFNNDGRMDLFVTNESNQPNDLFYGQADGGFEKLNRGSIVIRGRSSMTASWGDIDNDGDFDVFIGNSGFFVGEKNQLYRNFGSSFGEVVDGPLFDSNGCTFGSAFGDYDNDGDLDLVVTNGFCNGNMQNQLFENQGDGSFKDVSELLVDNGSICSYGVAWADIDNDGFLDLVVANCKNSEEDSERFNRLSMNLGNNNHWLQLNLVAVSANRDAIGAKVRLKANIDGQAIWQTREIRSQSGYAGQNGNRLHFGLGDAQKVDSLIIIWPQGNIEFFENLEVDQIRTLKEGLSTSIRNPSRLLGKLQLIKNPILSGADSLQVTWTLNAGNLPKALTIVDALGRVVNSTKIKETSNAEVLQLKLNTGIYFVVLETSEGKITQRLLVQ
ncbi:MAG: FG-GAP-like repeat-containing protein [Bacteroidota bacterium]